MDLVRLEIGNKIKQDCMLWVEEETSLKSYIEIGDKNVGDDSFGRFVTNRIGINIDVAI